MKDIYEVWFRVQRTVNTDPRCYDGCNFSERLEWTNWEYVCGYFTDKDASAAATAFKVINPGREYQVRHPANPEFLDQLTKRVEP